MTEIEIHFRDGMPCYMLPEGRTIEDLLGEMPIEIRVEDESFGYEYGSISGTEEQIAVYLVSDDCFTVLYPDVDREDVEFYARDETARAKRYAPIPGGKGKVEYEVVVALVETNYDEERREVMQRYTIVEIN